MKSAVTAVSVFLIFTTAGLAAPSLDQFSDNINAGFSARSGQHLQQGVTAGATGKLTRIDLYVTSPGGAGTLTVNTGTPWHADTNLVQKAFYASSNWNWYSIDLSAEDVYCQAGDEFVIGVIGSSGSSLSLGGNYAYGGYYSGGELWVNGSVWFAGKYDLAFKTYVDTSDTGTPAVPAPSAAMLCTIGTLIVSRSRKITGK